MAYFKSLLAVPGPHTPLSRYTFFNGLFYMVFGLTVYAWPGVVQAFLAGAPFAGREEGLTRLAGMTLTVIGYLYAFGSRTRSEVCGLATVLDRALVPLFLLPLGLSGAVEPAVAYLFCVVDPVLGLGAFVIWKRSAPR